MNAKVKRLWLRALRSGKYKQAQGGLREDGKFCCLGVLCDVHAKGTGRKWSGNADDGFLYGHSSGFLPKVVRKWAGLPTEDPVLSPRTGATASQMNDSDKSFRYIADRIEKYL